MISVTMSSNEQGSSRADALKAAVLKDTRFIWIGFDNIPSDIEFSLGDNKFYVEVKDFTGKHEDNSDLLNSILGEKHLQDQVLTLRERGYPCRVLVLGDDTDLLAAIQKAVGPRYKGKAASEQISIYFNLIVDFEANCEGLRVYVWYFKASPWKRCLSRVHKILAGPDHMLDFPAPADKDRLIAAMAMLFRGMGPGLMRILAEDYTIAIVPRNGTARPISELPGFGPKRCEQLAGWVRA